MSNFPPEFLAQVEAAVEARSGTRKGQEIIFRCPNPAHEDAHPSARYNVKKAVWTCAACATGGGALDLAKRLGVPLPERPESPGLTLAEFAEAKGLGGAFLQSCGVRDGLHYGTPCVVFAYPDQSGVFGPERRRLRMTGDKFKWRTGDKTRPYGLSRLRQARASGYVLVLEGESDPLTCWQADMPALGLPGASNWRPEYAPLLDGITDVLVWREPDAGGDTLTAKIIKDVPRAKIIEANVKDASELWLSLARDRDAFREAVRELMDKARPAASIRAETLTREARELWAECAMLARDPDLLGKIEAAVTVSGYAGDTTAPMIAYMGIASRLGPRPINLHFCAASAAGKSRAVDAGKALHPPSAYHEIGAGSARALVYDDEADYQHKTVIVAEADSLPEEGPAASAVRALAADNCMRYATVERDEESGKFHTRHIVKPGPTGLITTSTRPLGEQMGTRMLTVTVSDSPEQTRQIMRAQAGGARGDNDGAIDLRPFHALQSWLEIAGDREVVIPFAAVLAELVPDSLVRVRRDFPQLLAMIGAMATLYQCQRPRDDRGRIVADLDDYRRARALLLDVFTETVSGGVSQAVRKTVRAVEELHSGALVEMPALAERLNLHRATVWRRVRQALRLGFLVNEETRRGQPAKLRPGAALPEDRPALPEVEDIEEYYEHPETRATAQPDGTGPIWRVSEEAVANPVARPVAVAQPETPMQPEMQPSNGAAPDTDSNRKGGAVARLHADRGDKDTPDRCSACGSVEIEGYTWDGEPRCAAHFTTPTDDPLTLSTNGRHCARCPQPISVIAIGDLCGRCKAKATAWKRLGDGRYWCSGCMNAFEANDDPAQCPAGHARDVVTA